MARLFFFFFGQSLPQSTALCMFRLFEESETRSTCKYIRVSFYDLHIGDVFFFVFRTAFYTI